MVTEVINGTGSEILSAYDSFISLLPSWGQNFISLFILVLLVVIYSIFVWKFYRFVSTKNIIKLNLNQYNKSSHPFYAKMIAGGFYLLEYIIILPFLIFFWFAGFTFFLILLTESLDINTLIIVSATIIAAIRMTSYYNEDLSRDIAKLLPFTLLAISLLNPGFFDVGRIITQFNELKNLIGLAFNYLGFIIILEIILRLFDFMFTFFGLEDDDVEEKEKA